MENLKIILKQSEAGMITVVFTYTKDFNGGTDDSGKEIGMVEREFESTISIKDEGQTEQEIIAIIKKRIGI